MIKDERFASIHWLRVRYDDEAEHSDQVAGLALQLFDQLAKLHQLGIKERELLNAAALLHDIGQYYGFKSHHKSSKKIIMQTELDGWKNWEKRMIAQIARYHRKSFPTIKHNSYRKFDKKEQIVINKLTAILRIADGLDRSHTRVVQKIKCTIVENQVQLDLLCKKKIEMEEYGLEKKRGLFHTVFKKEILIKNVEIKKTGGK